MARQIHILDSGSDMAHYPKIEQIGKKRQLEGVGRKKESLFGMVIVSKGDFYYA